jgi:Cu-processing system permease protein
MGILGQMIIVTLRSAFRDRLLHVLSVVALILFLLVPAFSLFSMRQVQELSITLSLSAISFILLVIATLLGSSSIWRDIERRYTTSLLGLPLSRSTYVLGKFAGIAIVILLCSVLLGLVALAVIVIASAQYRSDIPVIWLNIIFAILFDGIKYILVAALALLFSSFSTSFFLPFFSTIAIYLAGSASQEVYEYISGDFGKTLLPISKVLIKGVYYLLPNFTAFNLKVQAIYAIPLSMGGLFFTFCYFIVYTGIVISLAVWVFSRRELP